MKELLRKLQPRSIRELRSKFRKLKRYIASPKLSVAELKKALKRLKVTGTEPVIFIHASMSKMSRFEGSYSDIVNILFEIVGQNGTIVMPGYSYTKTPLDTLTTKTFVDLNTAMVTVGKLNEHFRNIDGTLRSTHATHSVLANGKLAKYLIDAHDLDESPFGYNSPFFKLEQLGAYILFLDADPYLHTTQVHVAEDILGNDFPRSVYLEKKYEIDITLGNRQKKCITKIHNPEVFKTIDLTPVIDKIKSDHFYQEIRLKNLTFSLIRAADISKVVRQMAKMNKTIYD